MRKYAVDVVTSEDSPLRIVDKKTDRVVVIDNISDLGDERLHFEGYFDDNGDSYDKVLDHDSQLVVE